ADGREGEDNHQRRHQGKNGQSAHVRLVVHIQLPPAAAQRKLRRVFWAACRTWNREGCRSGWIRRLCPLFESLLHYSGTAAVLQAFFLLEKSIVKKPPISYIMMYIQHVTG
ncbi:MAG: hypothetical protein IJQ98_08890, partial [Oscillospiraceae bacterium]|nr:hypothetical protein [Oscillospiraceae bacterium]